MHTRGINDDNDDRMEKTAFLLSESGEQEPSI